MYWNLLGTLMILVFCCVCGIVCYAFYFDCDPYMLEKITRYDQVRLIQFFNFQFILQTRNTLSIKQMLPYFVMDILKNYYGLAGLFIACVYSAALSTVSSGLNSLVAVFMHDFIYPFNVYMKKDEISQKMSMILSKLLGNYSNTFKSV
jgi:sodium-coupled monocarboxylate transporter 8/12